MMAPKKNLSHCFSVGVGRCAHLTDIRLSLSESLLFWILFWAVRKSSFWIVSHVISLLAAFPFNFNTNRKAEFFWSSSLSLNSAMMCPSSVHSATPKSPAQVLTKVVDLDRRHFTDGPLDEQIDVREDDEWRSQGRTGVVLNDQVVALELPVDVAVGLHFREGVTGGGQRKSTVSVARLLMRQTDSRTLLVALYLNMAMSRLMSRMLVTSR